MLAAAFAVLVALAASQPLELDELIDEVELEDRARIDAVLLDPGLDAAPLLEELSTRASLIAPPSRERALRLTVRFGAGRISAPGGDRLELAGAVVLTIALEAFLRAEAPPITPRAENTRRARCLALAGERPRTPLAEHRVRARFQALACERGGA